VQYRKISPVEGYQDTPGIGGKQKLLRVGQRPIPHIVGMNKIMASSRQHISYGVRDIFVQVEMRH
jgi:hypothetical protein